ncbi:MAG: PQQ-dependent sugar dehydrogenase [Acidimicrobiales bacterium]
MIDLSGSVRRFLLVALAVVLAGTASAVPAHAATTATPVATGLAFPAAFTFAPDGRIFYGERFTGQVRILTPGPGTNTLFFTVPNVVTDVEQGLLGIALHPAYPNTPYVYVSATGTVGGVTENQIVRVRDVGGVGSKMTVIHRAPASAVHNGGRIMFGPDKRLYVVVGDRQDPANSQNLNNTHGKILRMTPSGAVPGDNPIAGSLIWAYGIRNSFGFTFDPQTRVLWETENGPACNDELNRVVKGRNYGWGPTQTCASPPARPLNTNRDGPNPALPASFYNPTTAPTGVAFCSGCGLGAGAEGHLFYGAYNSRQIREVTLDVVRKTVVSEILAYQNDDGILGVERGPDGALYFSDPVGIYRLVSS